ncbi:RsmE family RNA methyltransferase [Miniphocaeibacter halophilus]|uniref:16S rRNA (Uracil(1498)-N(3))-methyltransferase n=1 Tax=Miniphocaeibacter halophilus TaxID=2931922 RepID=A0AC61MPY0_9FIRM|nr:RsmE family RNA methyltransferase [Miniphocaeibacter halophilus]QQK07641.1 16S rRNA (uracil(1498)-N(3))-methyltransferase [Miniphocaeibacter halophilus]
MHRIFRNIEDVNNNNILIDGEDFHHLKNVLRMKKDEELEIVINENLYISKVSTIEKNRIIANISSIKKLKEETLNIHLYQGLTKSDKFDLIIQKSVELGVYRIIPIITNRVIVKLNSKNIEKKLIRFNKISKHAASQSHRNYIPKVYSPINLSDITLEKNELGLLAYESSENYDLKDILKSSKVKNIKIIIGPEGGFDSSEVLCLENKGFKTISLGKRILRTETAPITMLSILQYEIGDMNR